MFDEDREERLDRYTKLVGLLFEEGVHVGIESDGLGARLVLAAVVLFSELDFARLQKATSIGQGQQSRTASTCFQNTDATHTPDPGKVGLDGGTRTPDPMVPSHVL